MWLPNSNSALVISYSISKTRSNVRGSEAPASTGKLISEPEVRQFGGLLDFHFPSISRFRVRFAPALQRNPKLFVKYGKVDNLFVYKNLQ